MSYSVVEADMINDRNSIIELWKNNYGDEYNKRIDWLFTCGGSNAKCYILKDKKNSIVGMCGIHFRNIYVNDVAHVVGHAIDLLIDKDHRTAGPALLIQRYIIDEINKSGVNIIYGFPNLGAQVVLKRLGYKKLGEYKRFIKILNANVIIEKYLPKLPSNILSILVNFILAIKSGEYTNIFNKMIVNDNTVVDERFDKLWSNRTFKPKIIGERNSSYLKWRFENHYDTKYSLFTITNYDNQIAGYVVYKRDGTSISIHDFYACDHDGYKLLLTTFSNKMKKNKVNYMSLHALLPNEISHIFSRCGYMERPSNSDVFIYHHDKNIKINEIDNKNSWYITDADKDVES